MPKISFSESALHGWVNDLTFQQQALLMTGMRGPDGCNKHNAPKAIVRFLRGAICKPAGNWDGKNNNDFMWGDYSVFKIHAKSFFDDPDSFPHHFIMHLIHCAEVIGYKHPDDCIAHFWRTFYEQACHAFHMYGETEEEMDRRLNDFGVGPASHPAPAPMVGERQGFNEWIDQEIRACQEKEKNCEDPGRGYWEGRADSLDFAQQKYQSLATGHPAPVEQALPEEIKHFSENAPDNSRFDEWPQTTAYETGWQDASIAMYHKMQDTTLIHALGKQNYDKAVRIKELEEMVKEKQQWINSHI